MNSVIKLINLPWTFSRHDVVKFLNQTHNVRVKQCRVMYDQTTGLSRGIARVTLMNEAATRKFVQQGALNIDGRTILVTRPRNGEQDV